MLTEHVAEARALLEGIPTGASAAASLPTAVRWLLGQVRKDAKGREKLLDGVEGIMEGIVERLTAPTHHTLLIPPKKGKKAAAVTPEPPSHTPAFDIKAMTPQELFTRTIEELDKNKSSVVSNAIDVVRYEEAFEEWLIAVLNEEIHTIGGLGPWSCGTTIGSGEMTVRIRIAGDEQDEDTEHPGDTEDAEIAKTFKNPLGADNAQFNWSIDRTPQNWEFGSGGLFVLNYDGKAEFKYRDGQAAVFALGNKPLIEIASKVLARAQEG